MPKRRRFDSKAFRDRHGMRTAEDMADAVGVHVRTIRNWDSGERVPSHLAFQKLKEIERARRERLKSEPATQTATHNALTEAETPVPPVPADGPVRRAFIPSSR